MIIASKRIEWMGNQRMGCKMVAWHCEAPFVFVQHWKPSHYDWYRRYLKEKKNKQYDLPNLYIYTKTRKQYPHGLTYFWGKSGCKWSYKSPWWFLSKCKPVKKSQPSLKAQHNLFWVLETTLYVKKEHVSGETLIRNRKQESKHLATQLTREINDTALCCQAWSSGIVSIKEDLGFVPLKRESTRN